MLAFDAYLAISREDRLLTPYLTSMPAVQPPAKVLVTGVNGYIAAWLCRLLLEEGYSVRGTVRSASKGVFLQKLFEGYGERFEIVVVQDITKVCLVDWLERGEEGLMRHAGRRVRRGCQGRGRRSTHGFASSLQWVRS